MDLGSNGVAGHVYREENVLLYMFVIFVSAHGVLILVSTQRVVRWSTVLIARSTQYKIKSSVARRPTPVAVVA